MPPPPPSKVSLTTHRLGRGSFASVYLGYYAGSPVAIKHLPLHPDPTALSHFRRELSRYKALRHPCITQFFCVAPHRTGLLLVTELMNGGSLFDALADIRRIPAAVHPAQILRIARQIANGLAYLHACNFSFGDLKSMNVLLSHKPASDGAFPPELSVKLCDFGLSRNLNHFISPKRKQMSRTMPPSNGPTGTFAYMSPEAFSGIPPDDVILPKQADIYALGIVLWELATLRTPWPGKQPLQLVRLVRDEGRRPQWGPVTGPLVDLVERCWSQEPADRPSADEVATDLTQLEQLAKSDANATFFSAVSEIGDAARVEEGHVDEHIMQRSGTIRYVESMRILHLNSHVTSDFSTAQTQRSVDSLQDEQLQMVRNGTIRYVETMKLPDVDEQSVLTTERNQALSVDSIPDTQEEVLVEADTIRCVEAMRIVDLDQSSEITVQGQRSSIDSVPEAREELAYTEYQFRQAAEPGTPRSLPRVERRKEIPVVFSSYATYRSYQIRRRRNVVRSYTIPNRFENTDMQNELDILESLDTPGEIVYQTFRL